MPTPIPFGLGPPPPTPPAPPPLHSPLAGSGVLTLEAVSVLNRGNTLRVTLTTPPLQTSPTGAHDALNVANWAVTGAGFVTVITVTPVSGDAASVFLGLGAPLPSGNWQVTAANLQTAIGTPLTAPKSLPFSWVSPSSNTEPLNPGAASEDAESVLRKHWPPAIQGFNTNGLIAGIAAGDATNFLNAELIGDQLHRSTASGIYLDRRMSDYGLQRPSNVGLSDSAFRQLGLKVTNRKLITLALLDVLNAYYGQDSCRAHATSGLGEPYSLQDGWTLTLLIDGQTAVTVPIKAADYTSVSAATAVEVASVITRWLKLSGSEAYALAFFDPNSGQNLVRIYSGSLGLAGVVTITGGGAQNVLQFPALTTQSGAGDTWVITLPAPGVVRYTISSNATTTDLTKVQVGDYVNAFGLPLSAANQGTLQITNVDVRVTAGTLVQFFEVANGFGVSQTIMTSATSLMFFRALQQNINVAGSRAVIVAEVRPNEVDVQLPTTTIAVERGPGSGAYAVVQPSLNISSLIRQPSGLTTITTTAPHGLTGGQWFFVDAEVPVSAPPASIPGNGTTTTNANPTSIWTGLGTRSGGKPAFGNSAVTLQNGQVLVVGGYDGAAAWPDSTLIQTSTPVVQANGGTRWNYVVSAAANYPSNVYLEAASVLIDANQNGNVLVSGGNNGVNTISNSYIYNVSGNTWSANHPLGTARQLHAQVTLLDGRVIAIGGEDNTGTPLSSTEIFTPTIAGGSWAAGPSMAVPRGFITFAAVRLSDGKVLVVGGDTGSSIPTGTCEIFDPGFNTFSLTGHMTNAQRATHLIWLPGDQVLAVGGVGWNASQPQVSLQHLLQAEIFDYKTQRWYPAGSLGHKHVDPIVVYLPASNKVMVTGGNETGSKTVELFDVATRTWSQAPADEALFRHYASASVDGNGNVVVVGGQDDSGVYLNSVDLYQPAGNQISSGSLNAMQRVVSVLSATQLTFQTAEALDYTASASAPTLTPVNEKPAALDQPGPYVWDTVDGPAIGNVATTTTTTIRAGQQYSKLGVTSTAGFPDSDGFLCLGFGTSDQVFPVHYVGLIDSLTLSLDFNTVFPVDIPAGAEVTLLVQKGPWTPTEPTTSGSFYLTDTATARVAAESNLSSVAAAGITLIENIVYPGDRGLGGEGFPTAAARKLSDRVEIWASDDVDAEVAAAHEGF